MNQTEAPVAVFDSGLGGISVLRELVRVLPQENFLYYGDSLHAPYGIRPVEEVLRFSRETTEFLLQHGAKALVIACNTATSAAAETLRHEFPSLPIIGTEPALKPAVEHHPGGRILVLATAMTLTEKKFQALRLHYQNDAKIIPVPCSGLMEFVERGELESAELDAFLLEKLSPHLSPLPDAVVLGCTHYPFLQSSIRKLVGPAAEILDGSHGIAAQLRRRLEQAGLLSTRKAPGQVTFLNSMDDPSLLARSKTLLQLP